jgi:hypothetical protein
MKKEGKDWPTFLLVSNCQIGFPPSPSKLKTPNKKTTTPPIASYVPSSKITQSSAPSPPTLEIAHPFSFNVPSTSKTPHSPRDLIPQRTLPVHVYKRDKRKGKAQEVVQTEPPMELPPMEIEDNPPTIQDRVDTPSLRRSSRRNLVLTEESLPRSDVVKTRSRLSRFKVSPLEKEALEAIVQLSESPPESSPETEKGPRENWDKLFKYADRQLKEVQEKNQRLYKENFTLGRQLSSQIDELAGECNHLKKNIRKKMIQRKQLVNIYKQNLSLREENKKLEEHLYLAKNILSKKNFAIFLKDITSSSSPKHDD